MIRPSLALGSYLSMVFAAAPKENVIPSKMTNSRVRVLPFYGLSVPSSRFECLQGIGDQ